MMEDRDRSPVSKLDTINRLPTRWEMLTSMEVEAAGRWMSEHFICPPTEEGLTCDTRRRCADCWIAYLEGVDPDD